MIDEKILNLLFDDNDKFDSLLDDEQYYSSSQEHKVSGNYRRQKRQNLRKILLSKILEENNSKSGNTNIDKRSLEKDLKEIDKIIRKAFKQE